MGPQDKTGTFFKESVVSTGTNKNNNNQYVMSEGVEIESEEERHHIQQIINNFNEEHKEVTCHMIAEHMLTTYRDLVHTSLVNSMTYQELLKSKTLLKNVLEDVTNELERLK